MAMYSVIVYGGTEVPFRFASKSRNSKRHLMDSIGAEFCDVYTMSGNKVSSARRWRNGMITNVAVIDDSEIIA